MSRLKQQGRQLLAKKDRINAPEFNLLEYDTSLIKNLNFYRVEVDILKLRGYATAYWESIGKDIKSIKDVGDSYFSTAGALAHMHYVREVGLSDSDVSRLDSLFDNCLSQVKVKEEGTVRKKEVYDPTSSYIAELENAVDELITKDIVFDVNQYIIKTGIKPSSLNKISAWFKPRLAEFNEALSDKGQLKEAYAYLGKRGLNKLIAFVAGIVDTCDNLAAVKKTVKPRAKKVKPASIIVKGIKYLKDFVELGLKSIDPAKIVDSEIVWLYNTDNRKLIKVCAAKGKKLSAKGTSIINFDEESTVQKNIRKPTVQLNKIQSMSKRNIIDHFNSIMAVEGKFSGRISDKMIILSVF